jgi:hypothetical protein
MSVPIRGMKCNWELLEFRVWFSDGKYHNQLHTVWPELLGFGGFKGSGDCNFRPFFKWLAQIKSFSFSCASGRTNDYALAVAEQNAANSLQTYAGRTWKFAKLYLYRGNHSDAISRQLSIGVYLDLPVILHYSAQGGNSHLVQFGTKWDAVVSGTEQY